MNSIDAWTDYPFHVSDAAGEIAPIRKIKVTAYDGNKYCRITFQNKQYDGVKSGYIYKARGRIGCVPAYRHYELEEFFHHSKGDKT